MSFILKVLLNYLMLLSCTVVIYKFNGAGGLLMLPVLQAGLSWFNYRHGGKWQTVLMLEIHLLIATVAGILIGGFLYLKYVSGDSDSAIMLQLYIMSGVVLVGVMGTIATFLKKART